MRNFLDKNFNEVSGPASVGVTVNNGNFPHLQTVRTGYIWCRIQHSPSHHTAIVDNSSNQTTGDIPK